MTTTIQTPVSFEPQTIETELHENIQFIYELALSQQELDSFGIPFAVTNSLRHFLIPASADVTPIITRSAYFLRAGEQFSHYHFIQQFNRTRSVNQYLTHWIYPYKGKYHPQMIRALLNVIRIPQGALVLDPFIGSGTTAVECMLLGINCIAIDVSPLCALISRVKTLAVEKIADIEKIRDRVLLPEDAKKQLTLRRRDSVRIQDIEDPIVKDFFSLAEMVSRSDESRRGRDFAKSFDANVEKMIGSVSDLEAVSSQLELRLSKPDVRVGDARRLDIPANSIDGIITSPPYSIALNYVENDAHALTAMGYDLRRIKEDFIGVRASGKEKFDLYNKDMDLCYREMYRVLKPGAGCIVVLGNVTVQNEEVNTTGAAIESCKGAGFRFVKSMNKIIFGLYNVMQKEYILLFEKPGP